MDFQGLNVAMKWTKCSIGTESESGDSKDGENNFAWNNGKLWDPIISLIHLAVMYFFVSVCESMCMCE